MKFYRLFVLYCFLLFSLSAQAAGTYASHSVLSSGRWVKIQVQENGIYKLTDAQLRNMGFNDPTKVSIHGYGGWMLSETLNGSTPDDLPTIPVYRGNGYILFYGKGTVRWEYGSVDGEEAFVHENNPYATAGYYFVTDATATKTMETQASTDGAVRVITTYDDYQVWEKDQVSPHRSGRELYGESFSINNTRDDFSFNMPGITSADALVTMRFIAKTTARTSVELNTIDGTNIISTSIAGPGSNETYVSGRSVTAIGTWQGTKDSNINFSITYGAQNSTAAYLDYIRLQATRELRQYGEATFFRSLAAREQVSRFIIANATSSTMGWDITDGENPVIMEGSLSDTEYAFSIGADNRVREFVAIEPDQITATPNIIGEIENQDLHGLEQTDMVIIVPTAFKSEAERLAEFHRTNDGLKVTVIEPDDIYNEFSSGTPDATAYRRLMKMFYDRGQANGTPPKYLLLFGDGSYDNRGLTTEWSAQSSLLQNMLLTYQSENSLNLNSYTTDDYFGFLEDDTQTFYAPSATQCLGIGRFPVRTIDEAEAMVDKVVNYISDATYGDWKTNLCFMADDGSNADAYTTRHMEQANELTEIVNTNRPDFRINKLYFDAYQKDRTGGNASYPGVEDALQKLLKNGLFLLNYTGHGGTEALSDERVITRSSIMQSTYKHLPLWITATCDFTRFDELNTSAGEEVFLNENSGGIALYTTTRSVDSRDNFNLNQALIEQLFTTANGEHYTLGEIMKETKVSLGNNLNKLCFLLVGDPALRLAYPENQLKITEINGTPVDNLSEPIQLKALSKVTIKGEAQSYAGTRLSNFNGLTNLRVLDSQVEMTTLDNNSTGSTFTYTDYPNTIYLGADSCRNGEFTFSFTVPKDISYSNDYGKMVLYAYDETNKTDAQGAFQQFIVGGTAEDADDDTQGPDIRYLYLNDTTFTDGGKVNSTPLLVACIFDENGVNITGSSIGHDMVLTIDNSIYHSYVLNDYFQILPDESGAGLIVFSIPELEEGMHTAELKVWDVLNNSTSQTFTFEVVADLKPELINLTAGPIPARDQIRFFLTHNRPETQLTVTIQVFDMAGRLMWSHEETGSSDLFENYIVTWDLCNNSGNRLYPGVYLYRACMRSGKSSEVMAAKKLIILAQ